MTYYDYTHCRCPFLGIDPAALKQRVFFWHGHLHFEKGPYLAHTSTALATRVMSAPAGHLSPWGPTSSSRDQTLLANLTNKNKTFGSKAVYHPKKLEATNNTPTCKTTKDGTKSTCCSNVHRYFYGLEKHPILETLQLDGSMVNICTNDPGTMIQERPSLRPSRSLVTSPGDHNALSFFCLVL